MLQIQDLWVRYRNSNNWILKDINIKLNKGELIVIAGPSGSGKSTLAQTIIKLIPGFIPAEIRGSILIEGKDIQRIRRRELLGNIGYVPQYPSDFTTTMLVEEEIAFPLENQSIKRSDCQNRIDLTLKRLQIDHLRYKLMTELSSGELQRVALATAIALNPPILILDEPMARIDPKSEISLAEILKNLATEGHLILAFEHRLDYLLPEANQVVFIDEGVIKGIGTPVEIIDKIKGIDIPEVSEIVFNGQSPPLTVEEAISLLQEFLSDLQ